MKDSEEVSTAWKRRIVQISGIGFIQHECNSLSLSLSLSHTHTHPENNCMELTNKGETKKTFSSVEDHTGVRKHRSVQNEEQQVPDACSVYMICLKEMKYKVYTKAAVQHTIADPISSPIGFCP
jgi:hypothetical protein